MADVPWSDEALDYLRALWAAGISTSEIARRVTADYGVPRSKNAVIGRAHRIGLPGRASPIIRSGRQSKPRAVYLNPLCGTLPALPSEKPTLRLVRPVMSHVPVKPPEPPIVLSWNHKCCWPIGEVKAKDFRFCDAPAEFKKPYCPVHCKIAYRPLRDRRDAA